VPLAPRGCSDGWMRFQDSASVKMNILTKAKIYAQVFKNKFTQRM
jgi:hypothetical protein